MIILEVVGHNEKWLEIDQEKGWGVRFVTSVGIGERNICEDGFNWAFFSRIYKKLVKVLLKFQFRNFRKGNETN